MNFSFDFLAGNPAIAAGIWDTIMNTLSSVLEFFFNLTMSMGMPSYVLSMFLFTVIIKLLLQPLMNKQMRSTRKIQMLAPEIEQLKKRYASNPQKLNEATMKLYKEHGASPTAGCLPLLVQMPIIIALYRSIYALAQNPNHPEFFSINWIGSQMLDLGAPDPTKIVLPLLAAAATFFQQYISTANAKDRTQRMMLLMMPVMFFFMVRSFPSLVAFYWIFYSIIGALIYIPLRYKWNKEDKIEAERMAAEREAEAEAKRVKKEKAREAAREQKKQRQQANPAYAVEEGDFEEETELLIDEDFDEDAEQDPEKLFRHWLAKEGITVKTRKERLHPYSPADEKVEYFITPDGRELNLSQMSREYQQATRPDPKSQMADMKAMFGLGGRKKKKEDDVPLTDSDLSQR